MGNWLGRAFSFALVLVVLAWAAPAAYAQGDEPPDGDVYLIVSVDPVFDTDIGVEDEGSPVIVVRIGSLASGVPSPRETQFTPEESPPTVPLGTVALDDLDGNESTIFGSYTVEEFDPEEESTSDVPHMVTPGAVNIAPEIQAAVFAAADDLATEVEETGGLMTTAGIAQIVQDNLLEGQNYSLTQIAEALFGSSEPLRLTGSEGDFSCEAEGELFPHPKDEVDPIFVFALSFDQDGALTTDVCFPADVEVKESSINLKKKGSVSFAIYDSETLETDEIATVEILGVLADKIQIASKKATAQFDLEELADVLTSSTTKVAVVATLEDGTCFAGIAEINVK